MQFEDEQTGKKNEQIQQTIKDELMKRVNQYFAAGDFNKDEIKKKDEEDEVHTLIKNVSYLTNEEVQFGEDVYQLTIALFVTNALSPAEMKYCLG